MKNQGPPSANFRKEKSKSSLHSFQESDAEEGYDDDGGFWHEENDAPFEEEKVEEGESGTTDDEEGCAASAASGGSSKNVTVIFYTPDAEMMESEPFLGEMSYVTKVQREISNKMN